MCESALSSARGEVEILVGTNCDEDTKAYFGLSDLPGVRMFTFGAAYTVSEIWNLLAQSARGDLLLMGNDDQAYVTPGWDVRFEEEAGRFPDGMCVLWCDDGINGDKHAAFPCVTRKWYETLGYFAPEQGFRFFFNDTWAYDLGHRVGRLRYMPDVLVRHDHWTRSGVDDETTKLNRKSAQSAEDRRKWTDTIPIREAHAAKLMALMNEGASLRPSSAVSSPARAS